MRDTVLIIKTQEEFDSKIIDKRFYHDGNVIFECNIDSPKVKIDVRNIQAFDIKAWNINADDIKARDIKALDINANNIVYNAVCFTYYKLKAKTIKGTHSKSRHFSLSDDLEIDKKRGLNMKIKCFKCKGKGFTRDINTGLGILTFGITALIESAFKYECDACDGKGYLTVKKGE
jgi:hypothetical protein